MGLLDDARRVADHPRNEASDGFDHRHGRHFAPVENVVTEAYEANRAARGGLLEHALVDALVPSAPEDEVLLEVDLLDLVLEVNLDQILF